MAFCLVFVFETVAAELASVLLVHLMGAQFLFAFKFLGLFRTALAHKLTAKLRGIGRSGFIGGLNRHFPCR